MSFLLPGANFSAKCDDLPESINGEHVMHTFNALVNCVLRVPAHIDHAINLLAFELWDPVFDFVTKFFNVILHAGFEVLVTKRISDS